MTRGLTGGSGPASPKNAEPAAVYPITAAGVAGSALVGIAGCGGGGESGGSGSFNVAMGQDTTGTLPTLIKRFNKQYQGEYKATLGEYPTASDQYFDKLRTQFQAGGEGLDAVGGDVIWPAQFAANGFIADISDRFPESERNKFLPGPIESNTYDGQVFGVPWFTDGGLLYYRSDLLEESGFSEPPKTWDELKEQAKKVMQDQGTKYGFVWQGADYEGGVCNGLEYIYSHGGAILNEDNASEVLIGSPEAAAGLAMARSLIEDGVSPQAVTTFTETEADPRSSTVRRVRALLALRLRQRRRPGGNPNIEQSQVGIAPLPAGPAGSVSTLGGWNYFLSATSQNPDAAYDVDQVRDLRGAAALARDGRFFPADAQQPVRGPGVPRGGAAGRLRQAGAAEHRSSPGLPVLFGHVAAAGRAVQRGLQRARLRRRRR